MVEACDALSALCQHDSSQQSMVVVRRYSNTPYIPKGTSHSPYLDVGPFSWGVASTQFPLDRLHLHQLLSINRTDMLLPCEEGEERMGTYPHLSQDTMGEFGGGTSSFPSDLPVSPHASFSSTPGRVHPD